MKQIIMEYKDLSVDFPSREGTIHAIRNLSLELYAGEILAIVGESGSGKSVLCKAAMKLLPPNTIYSGEIRLDNENILQASEKTMRSLRGRIFSMIFQDPMLTLNPTLPVGEQIMEAMIRHQGLSTDKAMEETLKLLNLVGIPDAAARMQLQPHFFSGGMRQRLVLAAALAAKPQILFADEPTTALDVTLQAQILDLLKKVQQELNISIIFITHDLSVVAKIADRVGVMYAGKLLEIGTTDEIFYDARHPYTRCLLKASPYNVKHGERLYTIPGMPPSMHDDIIGDAFAPRNPWALAIDYAQAPPFFAVSPTHKAATWLLDSRAPQIDFDQPPTGKE